ncbi:hypothetical protein FHX06_007155 [Rhizobium sp. BK512]|uniref:hypothetical protein n=1 Tax=Rhizobium sp. BK512 TaxID=2587010 RepID=UPI00161105CD|nr:hypothetical protein [Rhizobium sp. BK512]MBB3565782.1 hypothetical protein [Rhizobium sp. BK512]
MTFYGKVVDREGVLKDKATFAQRWPERIYSVKPGSESAGMSEFSWVSNRAKGKIESESGSVLATDRGSLADRVISQPQTENGECRAGSDAATIEQSCARREEIGAPLDHFGWCYGHRNEYCYQMAWHVCDGNSNRLVGWDDCQRDERLSDNQDNPGGWLGTGSFYSCPGVPFDDRDRC